MMPDLDLNGPRAQPFESWCDEWLERGIINRFDTIAARHPGRIAIDDGARHLSYAALAASARDLAALIAADAPPGSIGILLPHSASFWVAILGCIGAGRICAALDLHHPASRNAQILSDAGLAALIAPPEFDPQLGADHRPRLNWALDDPPPVAPPWPSTAPPDESTPAMVLYTSGSTGRPKGIANNQQALLQRVAQYVNACHLNADDRMLTLSSPCTIAGLREGLTALLTGATLHVLDAQRVGLGAIARRIRDSEITVLNAVPSMLRALMSMPDAGDSLRSLRVIRIGGEVVFWTDITLIRRLLPETCHIQIGYSSTEATGTQWFVPRDARPSGPFVPVGYVLPGNVATVMDDAGRPLPPDETGELVLRGRFIALGTWQNGRCVPGDMAVDPAQPNARILRTGDLVHMDAEGVCTVTGRKDRQVKINGVRVEPSEVEAALRALPDVADAAVIARRSEHATTLAAFVVPRESRPELAAQAVRDASQSALPPAMRPSRIHIIAAMPRLPSAKLDLRALQELDQEAAQAAPIPASAEQSASDTVIRAAQQSWRAVLGPRALENGLSFEAAGGNSLKLQLVRWLEVLLDRRLPLDLFSDQMRLGDVAGVIARSSEIDDDVTDERPTVFLFPGLDGDEPRLAQFRIDLRDRIRFVLIDYPDWPELVQSDGGFPALVKASVAQITAARRSGPLMLAGYSVGGHVAFAAAARLIALGRTLTFFGILDTDHERLAAESARRRASPLPDFRSILAETAYDRLHATAGFIAAKCARDVVGIERALRYAAWWRPLLPARTAFAFDRRMRMILRLQARWQWYRDGVTDVVDVPTVLFRSEAHAAGTANDLGWTTRCPRLSVMNVGGDHHAMLDPPHRQDLCARFAEAVRCATAETEAARA